MLPIAGIYPRAERTIIAATSRSCKFLVMSYTSCKNEYGVRYLREKIKEVERP
jgi:hypothetical protein